MRLFLVFLLLIEASCSVTTTGDPKEPTTEAEQSVISGVLDDLEQRFLSFGLEVDLRGTPIFVVDDPTRGGVDIAGLCRGPGKRIVLDRRLFKLEQEEGKIPMVWWTILHELGHCYFLRGHDESYVHAEKSKIFYFETKLNIPEQSKYMCRLESSVMYPGVTIASSLMSEEAKDYYILEMIRNHERFSLDMTAHAQVADFFSDVSLLDTEIHIDLEKALEQGYEPDQDCLN